MEATDRLTDSELYELRDIVACSAKTAPLYLEPERGNQVASTLRELTELRAEIEAVRGKVAKLDAHLQDGERMIHGLINADKRAGRDSEWHSGRLDIVEGVRDKMKEFGLITEARDGE